MVIKNLEIIRKTSKVYQINFLENGAPVDITGWTVYFTVKSKCSDIDDNAVLKKDVTTHNSPTGGITLIELTPTDTDIPAKNYHYDIKYKDADGNAGILVSGKISFKEPITQRG